MKHTVVGMPVRGCKETPDSRTNRCSRHPKDSDDTTTGAQDSEFDNVRCEKCLKTTGAPTMLMCGDGFQHGCSKGYHLECLTPPLQAVPAGDWFCTDCRGHPKTGADSQREDEAVRRGRTRSETRDIADDSNIHPAEKIVGIRKDAEVRCVENPTRCVESPARCGEHLA